MNDALNAIKRLFNPPSAQEQARIDLQHAQLAQLEAHAHLEHATAMVSYYNAQVSRLQDYLHTGTCLKGTK
jgi:hypothetical protein